ncbi:MAG: MFS transporter [Pyrinomonadaceae bacterium MAG19_C2-C3]|nr:MFS transporter [Pyrinomonadaceae bacterium MAG19_C2-C3]
MQVIKTTNDAFVLQDVSAVSPTRARYKVLSLLVTLASLTYLDRLCISAAAPAIIQEFNFTPVQMGYIFSAFTLTYALFEIPSGWLGDRFGTRKALTRIVLWWSAFTMLTGAVVGFWSLFFVRLMFGAGEAGAIPNSASTVARWFPVPQRGRAMGGVCVGHAIGASLTPPIVFLLIGLQGWRLTFVEFGALGFVWCLVWYVWFRDTPEEHPAANDAEINIIRSGLAAAPAHSHSIPWRTFLRSKNIFFLCAMYFAYGYSLYFYITWLPTYLLNARGFTIASAGFFSALPWVCGAVAFLCGGWITDRLVALGHRKLARCGLGAFGLTMSAVMLVCVALAENNIVAASLIAAALFFQFLTTPAVWATCMDIGRGHSGVVTGTVNTFGNLAGTIAPIAFGYILQKWGSWTIPFYLAAGFLIVGVVMWLFINPEQPLEEVPGVGA